MPLYRKDAGVFKAPAQGLWRKVGSIWQRVLAEWRRDAGIWKQVYAAGPSLVGVQPLVIGNPNAFSWSTSVTVPAGSTCLVIVVTTVGNNAPSISGVTFDGATLTEAAETLSGQTASAHFMQSPPVGSAKTLLIQATQRMDRILGATAYFLKDVSGLDAVGTADASGVSGGLISASLTTTAPALVIGVALNAQGTAAGSAFSAGVTLDHIDNVLANSNWRTHAAGNIKLMTPGPYTMSFGKSGMTNARMVVAAFK